nr:DUF3849 domain-containing protein [Flavonifractor plautii]
MNETYLYPYSAKEARERNELSLWRESHRANIACREAIEDTIRRDVLERGLPCASAGGIRLQAHGTGADRYAAGAFLGWSLQPRQ